MDHEKLKEFFEEREIEKQKEHSGCTLNTTINIAIEQMVVLFP